MQDGRIVEVGRVTAGAREVVDADGALVTPGWVDAHTHYDAQVTWDDTLEGSASNGVTTVVAGNCGVGFAPVRPDGFADLIDMMEGVEDIPGSALVEGMPWGEWESFPEYLDVLGRRSWTTDVAVQIGHGPLRYYVMGDRAVANDAATEADIAQMAGLLAAAVRAGAAGFSTSRTKVHRSLRGGEFIPGTFAPLEELMALGRAVAAGGGGVLQALPASGTAVGDVTPAGPEQASVGDEVELFAEISRATGLPFVFTTVQTSDTERWREVLARSAAHNATGARLRPMVAARGTTVLSTLSSYHPFMRRPTFLRLGQALSFDALVTEMRRPEVKAAILAEGDVPHDDVGSMENFLATSFFTRGINKMYPLGEPLDYEPTEEMSFAAQAAAQHRDPFDVVYDYLLEDGGRAVALFLGANYMDRNLDACRDMLLHPDTVTGLGDAGAHVTLACDMAAHTFALAHWARDRSRGEGLPVELIVRKATSVPATIWGMHDRGTVAVGKRADVNVIDFENLRSARPELLHDLPAGGSRFVQRAHGYIATVVDGTIVRRDDADTGARPGRLLRRFDH
ncbi:MAG: amidohydrolase family protein [Acidimicrobiia bacterium]